MSRPHTPEDSPPARSQNPRARNTNPPNRRNNQKVYMPYQKGNFRGPPQEPINHDNAFQRHPVPMPGPPVGNMVKTPRHEPNLVFHCQEPSQPPRYQFGQFEPGEAVSDRPQNVNKQNQGTYAYHNMNRNSGRGNRHMNDNQPAASYNYGFGNQGPFLAQNQMEMVNQQAMYNYESQFYVPMQAQYPMFNHHSNTAFHYPIDGKQPNSGRHVTSPVKPKRKLTISDPKTKLPVDLKSDSKPQSAGIAVTGTTAGNASAVGSTASVNSALSSVPGSSSVIPPPTVNPPPALNSNSPAALNNPPQVNSPTKTEVKAPPAKDAVSEPKPAETVPVINEPEEAAASAPVVKVADEPHTSDAEDSSKVAENKDDGFVPCKANIKKKGKKHMNSVFERKNDASYDSKEVDMSAYQLPVEKVPGEKLEEHAEHIVEPSKSIEVSPRKEIKEEVDDADWEEKEINPLKIAPSQNRQDDSKITYTKDYLLNIRQKVEESGMDKDWSGLSMIDTSKSNILYGDSSSWNSRNMGDKGAQPPGIGRPGMDRNKMSRSARSNKDLSQGTQDKWTRTGPLPFNNSSVPRPDLHKADNRFTRGMLLSENPEEERKQKKFKSLLNKITPEKYDIILQQLCEDAVETFSTSLSLKGLVDQIFDKALLEPTFVELYGNLCRDLSCKLPSFPNEFNGKDLTFRRVIVTKCQEEFAAGVASFDIKEKSEEENKNATEGDVKKEEAASQEELAKDRRRAFGNMQFIGVLFKVGLLTEKSIHEALKFLTYKECPNREDIECLCKLMLSIGAILDNPIKDQSNTRNQMKEKQARASLLMKHCFEYIDRLTKSSNIEARLRFMLQDVIDLRRNKWEARRKVEGPKTIDEIHLAALVEQQQAVANSREARSNRPIGRGGYRETSSRQLPQRQHDNRLENPPRPMTQTTNQFSSSQSGLFRPAAGSLASRGASPASRDGIATAPVTKAVSKAPANADAQKSLLEPYFITWFKSSFPEFNDDVKNALKSLDKAETGALLENWFNQALNKGIDFDHFKKFYSLLLEENLLKKEGVLILIESSIKTLPDLSLDHPAFAKWIGHLISIFIRLMDVSFGEIQSLAQALEMEKEDGPLVFEVFGFVLEDIHRVEGEERMLAVCKENSFQVDKFIDQECLDDRCIENLKKKFGALNIVNL